MRKDKRYFEVVDLDPYGTAIPFLESALSCISNDGLLCVTFTDMAVLCARKPHVCFYKYGAAPLGKSYCHEQALRMVLYTINSMANKHGKQIQPLVSLTVDFYVRLFIRVHDSLSACQKSISKYSNIHQCINCESFYLQRLGIHTKETISVKGGAETVSARRREKKAGLKEGHNQAEVEKEEVKQTEFEKIVCAKNEVPQKCGTCGSPLMIGGPIWNDKIHDIDFVKKMHETASTDEAKKFGTIGRIKGILGGIIDEEWLAHKPLSFDLNQICSNLKVCNPTKN
jgi:tRNA (guanine26-N2/guanine27-N2)-dimethyltransferase